MLALHQNSVDIARLESDRIYICDVTGTRDVDLKYAAAPNKYKNI